MTHDQACFGSFLSIRGAASAIGPDDRGREGGACATSATVGACGASWPSCQSVDRMLLEGYDKAQGLEQQQSVHSHVSKRPVLSKHLLERG